MQTRLAFTKNTRKRKVRGRMPSMTSITKKKVAGTAALDFSAFAVALSDGFTQAAKEAVAENDRLGIPSPSGAGDKVEYRSPTTKG